MSELETEKVKWEEPLLKTHHESSERFRTTKSSLHPILKKKENLLVSPEALAVITPLLSTCESELFLDTFFDSSINSLLEEDGVWLLNRSFTDGRSSVWKLRTSIKTTKETIQWTEFQGEDEILHELHLADRADKKTKLIPAFGIPFLYVPTMRFHLVKDTVWVDFVGWSETQNRGVFAVCSIVQDHSIKNILPELMPLKTDARNVNKTLLMLYHRNRGLFERVYGFGNTELATVPLGTPFEKFDHFFGSQKRLDQPYEASLSSDDDFDTAEEI